MEMECGTRDIVSHILTSIHIARESDKTEDGKEDVAIWPTAESSILRRHCLDRTAIGCFRLPEEKKTISAKIAEPGKMLNH